MRFLASVFVATLLVVTSASAEPEAIEFFDQVDPLAIVFDDPYRDMGFKLLNELKLLIEVDEKLSKNNFTDQERMRLTNRRKAAKNLLESNGYNIDKLFGHIVQQVGTCSHLTPPAPNELVRVRLLDDPKGLSSYSPIRISGLLRAEANDTVIFISDGEKRMVSGWTLNDNTVEQLQNLTENDLLHAHGKAHH
ncbi:DUF3299 domain-containing protein [Colwellia sp. RSH04]|uniref:DUF3299 domain-containing protein n=1 Tax=Colwellia sp. RSH04 TaxID=2305464 RepID=UPI000E588C39|nr:DUF3299 domain-containing protein [Colwellia sp. RSH04]RHW75681.1 DUF3299 domain-containing protein [Colwellia sp. RSH04]